MRRHNFIGNFDLNQKRLEIAEADFLHQVKNVLRLKEGDQVVLNDGQLNFAAARIVKIDEIVEVEIIKTWIGQGEPKISVTLYCSILKRENFELAVQKATEVGIKEIVPLVARNTVKPNFKGERLEKIIKEAAEQSGRGATPILRESVNFDDAVVQAKAKAGQLNLFFHPTAELTISDIIRVGLGVCVNIGVFVGPEGGWSEAELQLAKKKNFKIVSLGQLILRAETAAIIASYLAVGTLK